MSRVRREYDSQSACGALICLICIVAQGVGRSQQGLDAETVTNLPAQVIEDLHVQRDITRAARMADDLGWVAIPAGTFEMGCVPTDPACRPNEEPRHTVTITRPFELMATEVTVGQFRAYASATGRRAPRQPVWNEHDDHPVVNVTWEEVRDFCGWAGGRLPTEAEWEYAARGGHDGSVFPWGDHFDENRANGIGRSGVDQWTEAAPVGSFPPNDYGLFDMVGNVWEWVNDRYWDRYYATAPDRDPVGPEEGGERLLRGGCWDNNPRSLRLSFRFRRSPTGRYNLYIGGRCARDVRP